MKVVVLTPFPPRSDGRHGGARALASLHRRLAMRHQVVLLALRRDDEPPVDPALAAVCEDVIEVRRPLGRSSLAAMWSERRRARDVLRGRPGWVIGTDVRALHDQLRLAVTRHRPDLAHTEFAVMAQYAADVSVPVVVTDHSVAADGLDDEAMLRFRRDTYRTVQGIVCFTQRELMELRSVIDDGPTVHVIPLGVEIPPDVPDVSGADGSMAFVGNFEHPPNVDALRRIVEGVLPAVREQLPAARLVVVGAAPPRDLVERPGVIATGPVETAEPYLADAALMLGPVWRGGGMRVKVLEALAAGKPVVTTKLGADGIGLIPGVHAVIAEGEADIAREIVALLDDPERLRQLGTAGRAFVAERLAWDRIAPRYDAVYEEAVA